ncbi:protoporphyrinogen/coproporphyrinogen oxidase [Mycobacterium sp. IDR2000157661]|uniref:protoporphyrinogen/coproporphyrinogen oxidase n=1 Tax=Mycobacterium sp. IDR2000157661 TaxID=2867005 RepID=UPI001EEBAA1E|nr:FAD-dependent oxidoreductase [Mycobacterium sp. IDR2000157661]ULE33109.1 FAD-dependent oxidoreductase [Mycobacterium sp. IDR2000157661]
MTTSADLIVLGAGPAGLMAAWRAARAGRSVIVLERADVVGGMAASFPVAGVRVDHGSHRLHPSTAPEIMADLCGLLGDDLQTRPRHGRLRVDDRWVGFPLRPKDLARALPASTIARIGAEAITAPLRRRKTVASYADALRRGLGPTLYDRLYGPYAVKLWGIPGERIDPEQARVRVRADTPTKIAARMVRGSTGGSGRTFHYPRRGFGQIVESVAEAAVSAGAQLQTGAEVTAIRPESDHVQVSTADGDVLSAGHLFTTAPLPRLAALVVPNAPARAVADAAGLTFRAMVLVYLVHSARSRWTEFDATYLPDADTPISRISEPANYRVSKEDPSDRTVLCCEIPCAADSADPVWSATSQQLADLARDTLARLGLPPLRLDGPDAVQVRRIRHVYPVYEHGYAERLRGLDEWASALPSVTTFGRLGLFAHDNTHHAFAMAYAAVDALGAGGWDAGLWSAARDRFRDHVVED